MDFSDFIISYKKNLPPFKNNSRSKNIRFITKDYLDSLISAVNLIDSQFFDLIDTTKEFIISDLVVQKNVILESIDHFLIGDIVNSHNLIYNQYFEEKIDYFKNLFYKPIPKRASFYRLRENKSNKKFSKIDMFHIPFESIEKVGNQRFSFSGYPCLYLGSTSYCCWEELGKPNLDDSYFSILGNDLELNFFDLSPPLEIKKKEDLLRFPLIVASSIKYTRSISGFKAEYIIPQSIFNALIRFNNRRRNKMFNHNQLSLDGIIYLSTKISSDLYYEDLNNMYNYVIPTKNNIGEGYCKILCDKFIISDPISIKEIWIKYPQIFSNIDEYLNLDVLNKDTYELSVFNIIEKFLRSKNVNKDKIL